MNLSKPVKAAISFILLTYNFFVFIAFNSGSIEFIIQKIKPEELYLKVKTVFYGLGLMLVLQPAFAIFLLGCIALSKQTTKIDTINIIYIYVLANIGVCFLIFIYSATLPWEARVGRNRR